MLTKRCRGGRGRRRRARVAGMRRGQYVAAARRGVGGDGAGSFRCGGVLAVFSGGVNIIWIRYLVAKYDRFVGARRNLRRRGVASVGRNPRLSSPNWGCGLRLSAPIGRGAPAIVDKFSGQGDLGKPSSVHQQSRGGAPSSNRRVRTKMRRSQERQSDDHKCRKGGSGE